MAQKVYLHKAGRESEVFELDSEAYNEAKENGWTSARQFEEPKEETEEISKEDFTTVKDLDDDQLTDLYQDIVDEMKERELLADDIKPEQTEGEVSLSDMEEDELKAIAKELKIKSYASMKKETLINKIMEVQDNEIS